MPNRKYLLHVLGGGKGYTLEDTDLWGIECAIHDALRLGAMAGNEEWAKGMLARLSELRSTEDEPNGNRSL